ncbi:MAG: hypothetical protein WCI38_07135 [Chthoniobacterales bacterium]
MIAGAAVLAGCATNNTAMAQKALMCGKSDTVWVAGHSGGGKPGTYHIHSGTHKTLCSECETIGETFMKTGKLQHNCTGCQSDLRVCTVQHAGTKTDSSRAQ